jgi:hypothetical protein
MILGIDFLFCFVFFLFVCFFLDEDELWMCCCCVGFGGCALWSFKTSYI